jgi:hypothetical protein
VDISVSTPQRCSEPRVQAVVVEDADERQIQGEEADGQRSGRGDETRAYFVRGTNKLYRTMWNSAARPSRHVIFFPSA